MYFSDIALYFFDSVNHICLFLWSVFLRFQGWVSTCNSFFFLHSNRCRHAAARFIQLYVFLRYCPVFLWFCKPYFSVSVNCISQIPRLHSNPCRHAAARFIRSRNETKNFRFLWHPIAKSGPAQFQLEKKLLVHVSQFYLGSYVLGHFSLYLPSTSSSIPIKRHMSVLEKRPSKGMVSFSRNGIFANFYITEKALLYSENNEESKLITPPIMGISLPSKASLLIKWQAIHQSNDYHKLIIN